MTNATIRHYRERFAETFAVPAAAVDLSDDFAAFLLGIDLMATGLDAEAAALVVGEQIPTADPERLLMLLTQRDDRRRDA